MNSIVRGPVVAVEVKVADAISILQVHEGVVAAIPYLAAQQARWAEEGASLHVDLPAGIGAEAFALVIEKTYFPSKNLHCTSMAIALQAVQIATMLNCEQSTIDDFIGAVRDATCCGADVAAVLQFCEHHQAPVGLAKLAKRLALKNVEGPSLESVKEMMKNGLQRHDMDMLNVVERYLKQRSQCGEREEVADVLAHKERQYNESKEWLFAQAFMFTKAHPCFYNKIVDAMFYRSSFSWEIELLSEYFKRFVELGLTQVELGTLTVDNAAALYRRSAQYEIDAPQGAAAAKTTLLLHAECLSAFVAALPRMGAAFQLGVCSALNAVLKDDRLMTQLIRDDVFAHLAIEAKGVFVDRVIRLSDQSLQKALTEPILVHLTSAQRLRLTPRAYALQPPVKAIVLQSIVLPDMDSSDEGY